MATSGKYWAFAALFFWRLLANEDPAHYGFASADLFLYYYPVYDEIYARVRAGLLPRWNPWQLCGTPWPLRNIMPT